MRRAGRVRPGSELHGPRAHARFQGREPVAAFGDGPEELDGARRGLDVDDDHLGWGVRGRGRRHRRLRLLRWRRRRRGDALLWRRGCRWPRRRYSGVVRVAGTTEHLGHMVIYVYVLTSISPLDWSTLTLIPGWGTTVYVVLCSHAWLETLLQSCAVLPGSARTPGQKNLCVPGLRRAATHPTNRWCKGMAVGLRPADSL